MAKRVTKDFDDLEADPAEPAEIAAELTRNVGSRVRAIRSRRGLTRKNLAHHSDVSERYLARVEVGEANISLILLSRVAQALDVPLLSLLPHEPGDGIKSERLGNLLKNLGEQEQEQAFHLIEKTFRKPGSSKTGIALVGLRGAGKSTIGTRIAQRFKVPFVKLDNVITQMSGLNMGELISLTGQRVLRRYEQEALEQTIADYRQVVVEAGGSLVSEPETYQLLRSSYYTVWVSASPEEHLERVLQQGDTRPIKGSHQPMTELKMILEERSKDYQLADFQLATSNRSVNACVDELARVTAPYLQS